MKLYAVQLKDVFGCDRRKRLSRPLRNTDRRVVPMLHVRIFGVIGQTDLTRRFPRRSVMDVAHVHEVVADSRVVVVAHATWVGVTDYDVDMRDWQTRLRVEPERFARERRFCESSAACCGLASCTCDPSSGRGRTHCSTSDIGMFRKSKQI